MPAYPKEFLAIVLDETMQIGNRVDYDEDGNNDVQRNSRLSPNALTAF